MVLKAYERAGGAARQLFQHESTIERHVRRLHGRHRPDRRHAPRLRAGGRREVLRVFDAKPRVPRPVGATRRLRGVGATSTAASPMACAATRTPAASAATTLALNVS